METTQNLGLPLFAPTDDFYDMFLHIACKNDASNPSAFQIIDAKFDEILSAIGASKQKAIDILNGTTEGATNAK